MVRLRGRTSKGAGRVPLGVRGPWAYYRLRAEAEATARAAVSGREGTGRAGGGESGQANRDGLAVRVRIEAELVSSHGGSPSVGLAGGLAARPRPAPPAQHHHANCQHWAQHPPAPADRSPAPRPVPTQTSSPSWDPHAQDTLPCSPCLLRSAQALLAPASPPPPARVPLAPPMPASYREL
jgi:hypothetical protein